MRVFLSSRNIAILMNRVKRRMFYSFLMNPLPRPYQETDRESILKIAEGTWNGHDHLNTELDAIVKNHKSNPFVLEIDGTVVGFANLRIIDNGKTGWMETLRVHPDYRESGYGHLLTDYLVQFAREKRLSRLRLTLATMNDAPIKLAKSIGMNEILIMKNLWYGHVSEIKWSFSEIEMKEVTGSDSYYLLQSNPALMPRNIGIYFWYAFDTDVSSFNEVGKKVRIWAGRRKNILVALAFGLRRETPQGPEWSASIYAREKASFLSAISHTLHLCKSFRIESLMIQHEPENAVQYDSIEWMKSPIHQIDLALYERIL